MLPMRVLHVVLTLAPGGAERLVIELCRTLAGRVPSAVCCLDERGEWADQVEQLGVHVTALRRRRGFRPELSLGVRGVARGHGATVLHCHQYSAFVYGTLASLLCPGLRVVYTEHGRLSDAPASPKRIWANRLLGRLPDRIVAVCDDLRRSMLAEGFPQRRIEVIHNGIDPGPSPEAHASPEARHRLGLPSQGPVVGTVARLDPVKRLDWLIEAFAKAAIPGSRLVIVGGGPERETLSRRVEDRGLGDVVLFTGSRDDARSLLPAFDVYVNSSASEGVSLTLLEAMAAGVPPVATRVGGTPDVVEHDRQGLLVPPGDPQAMAGALRQLCADPSLRLRLGTAARARVVESFSQARMVRQYTDTYRG